MQPAAVNRVLGSDFRNRIPTGQLVCPLSFPSGKDNLQPAARLLPGIRRGTGLASASARSWAAELFQILAGKLGKLEKLTSSGPTGPWLLAQPPDRPSVTGAQVPAPPPPPVPGHSPVSTVSLQGGGTQEARLLQSPQTALCGSPWAARPSALSLPVRGLTPLDTHPK